MRKRKKQKALPPPTLKMNQALHNQTLYKLYNAPIVSEDEATATSLQSDPITPRQLARCAVPSSPPCYQSTPCDTPVTLAREEAAMAHEFASLSPERARQWEADQNTKRVAELKRRVEAEMSAAVAEDSSDSSDDDVAVREMDLNEVRGCRAVKTEDTSAESSLPKSTPTKPHNWDIDTLLEEHMREIDDCDFGSLNQQHLLGQQHSPVRLQPMKQPAPQRPIFRQQPVQQTGQRMQQMQLIEQQEKSTPSNMAITLSGDQSTVSSPGWSEAHQISQRQQTAAVASSKVHNSRASISAVTSHPLQNTPTSLSTQRKPPAAPHLSTEEQDLQVKLNSLQLQLSQVSSLNSTLQSRINNHQLQIQKLSTSEEEARQEAALWEAKWRDDTGNNDLLLPELRGALLQKTKDEVKELQSRLIDVQRNRNDESIELNLLTAENETLRRELAKSADGTVGPSSPSSAVQSDAMLRLNRMAKTSRESEQKWSLRVKELDTKIDGLRRENKVLTEENEKLKRASCDGERVKDLEVKLTRDRGEIDRLVKEKSSLVEELRSYRKLVDQARAEHDALRLEFETRLKEQTELHSREMEQFWGKKNTVDRGSDAIPFSDEKMDAMLAQISQENVTLQEENTGVSAENERLAKRCVDLERSVNEAASNAEDLRLALQNAKSRIEEFEKEKVDLENRISSVEQEVTASRLKEASLQSRVDETEAEKESIQQQMQFLLAEKQQLDNDLHSITRENEMLQSKNASLEEYHVNAQEELQSWQLAKEELEAELSATSEENATLKSNNIAMKERLDERQQLLDSIRKNEVDGALQEENRLLKSTLSGLESQLRGVENALEMERSSLTATRKSREHAEKRIGELELQIVSLQNDINSANSRKASERDDHARLKRQTSELKATIASLREEISTAAISRSQLELELRQRQDECGTLRSQLEPVQQEKYRLELDNANLAEQIERLQHLNGSDVEEDEQRSELVKRLEEKNNALAQCISSLQSDMLAYQSRSANKASNHPKTPMPSRPAVSDDMMEQLNRARAAVKETASIIKAQRRALSCDVIPADPDMSFLPSPIVMHSSDLSQSSLQFIPTSAAMPPSEITTSMQGHAPSHQTHTTPAPSFDVRTNLRMQLEEEHKAEKSALKMKYRERIKYMKKEWEGERKAILRLIASPSAVTSEGAYRVAKSPMNHPTHQHAAKETSNSTFGETETIDSSYIETETFVMNILNELDS